MVERRPEEPCVAGASPARGTTLSCISMALSNNRNSPVLQIGNRECDTPWGYHFACIVKLEITSPSEGEIPGSSPSKGTNLCCKYPIHTKYARVSCVPN